MEESTSQYVMDNEQPGTSTGGITAIKLPTYPLLASMLTTQFQIAPPDSPLVSNGWSEDGSTDRLKTDVITLSDDELPREEQKNVDEIKNWLMNSDPAIERKHFSWQKLFDMSKDYALLEYFDGRIYDNRHKNCQRIRCSL